MKKLILITLGSLPLLLAGCATGHKEPVYHAVTPSVTTRTGRAGGLEIGIDPFVEAERTRTYFGLDAAKEGIGIVYVHISNNTSNQVFLVEKSSFRFIPLGAARGLNVNSKTIEQGKAGAEATAWTGAVLSGLGGIAMIGMASGMIAHATEVQRNFVGKELPDQTLPPGQTMEGFIYFTPVAKGSAWNRGASIKATLTETGTQQPVSMTIPLSD